MGKRRSTVASFALICVFGEWLAAAQEVTHEDAAQRSLDLVTIGNGRLPGGTKTAFRVYEA